MLPVESVEGCQGLCVYKWTAHSMIEDSSWLFPRVLRGAGPAPLFWLCLVMPGPSTWAGAQSKRLGVEAKRLGGQKREDRGQKRHGGGQKRKNVGNKKRIARVRVKI